jgi:hypothetical protein
MSAFDDALRASFDEMPSRTKHFRVDETLKLKRGYANPAAETHSTTEPLSYDLPFGLTWTTWYAVQVPTSELGECLYDTDDPPPLDQRLSKSSKKKDSSSEQEMLTHHPKRLGRPITLRGTLVKTPSTQERYYEAAPESYARPEHRRGRPAQPVGPFVALPENDDA